MAELGQLVEKVRSKNAGPFKLTIDIFCGSRDVFDKLRTALPTERIATLLQTNPERLQRFDIASLNVIKFSLDRPQVQGSIHDRDMHGASWAALIAELEI